MRLLSILAVAILSLAFSTAAEAADSRRPSFKITKVDQGKKGNISTFEFFYVAKDNEAISKIEYRAAVDGKVSGWKKVKYYEGFSESLPFGVDCDVFKLEARSIDTSGNKSTTVVRTYRNLKG